MKTKEILKGAEAQRLRTFSTSNRMRPSRDLDDYGLLLAAGDVNQVRADFERRVVEHAARISSNAAAGRNVGTEVAEAAAADEIYTLRWGPTVVSIFQLLGLLRLIYPERAAAHLQVARFLIYTAKVPVDGTDLSGTQPLSHAFSTKPAADFEYAQVLFDAGGDVNERDRYGGTVAHEIIKVWTPQDKAVVAKATLAMKWYTLSRVKTVPGLRKLIDVSDRERKARAAKDDGCCALCGRERETGDPALQRCGRCKVARYCPPGVRACQKLDWPHHKKSCSQRTIIYGSKNPKSRVLFEVLDARYPRPATAAGPNATLPFGA
ncbi:hypothetical protein C8R43DRAFT_1091818 [Mycena crocata]|nr:hypothetical protein C8R43DRAFT_1091818 [Mycena crocata]